MSTAREIETRSPLALNLRKIFEAATGDKTFAGDRWEGTLWETYLPVADNVQEFVDAAAARGIAVTYEEKSTRAHFRATVTR